MTLNELLEQEKKDLDKFNLEVAKFRVKYGMSAQLIHLYGAMGRLSKKLIELEQGASNIEAMKNGVGGAFELMKERG